jgi:GAF domain-containing protein
MTGDSQQPGLDQPESLEHSLAILSTLSAGHMHLREMLTRVAELVVDAVPAADGAGLTLLERGHGDTIVASAPFVAEVDAIQYGIGEGPCITAAADGRTIRSGSLATTPEWPVFGPQVAHLGVNSALSLPLITPHGVIGAMNVYAHPPNAFDDRAARLGELFAVPAAMAVQNAQILAQARQLAQQLQAELANRSVIDQAVGILMSRSGSTAEEAVDLLDLTAGREQLPLGNVAQRLVDTAVRRAQERGGSSTQ